MRSGEVRGENESLSPYALGAMRIGCHAHWVTCASRKLSHRRLGDHSALGSLGLHLASCHTAGSVITHH